MLLVVHKHDGERTLCRIGRHCWSCTYLVYAIGSFLVSVLLYKLVPSLLVQRGDRAIVLGVSLWSPAVRNPSRRYFLYEVQ